VKVGPLGGWGPLVVAFVSAVVVVANIAVHVLAALGRATTDPYLDNLTVLILGGIGVIGLVGSPAQAAHEAAEAANRRLDAIAAPAVPPTHNGGGTGR
jgi:hypothetical protein